AARPVWVAALRRRGPRARDQPERARRPRERQCLRVLRPRVPAATGDPRERAPVQSIQLRRQLDRRRADQRPELPRHGGGPTRARAVSVIMKPSIAVSTRVLIVTAALVAALGVAGPV